MSFSEAPSLYKLLKSNNMVPLSSASADALLVQCEECVTGRLGECKLGECQVGECKLGKYKLGDRIFGRTPFGRNH